MVQQDDKPPEKVCKHVFGGEGKRQAAEAEACNQAADAEVPFLRNDEHGKRHQQKPECAGNDGQQGFVNLKVQLFCKGQAFKLCAVEHAVESPCYDEYQKAPEAFGQAGRRGCVSPDGRADAQGYVKAGNRQRDAQRLAEGIVKLFTPCAPRLCGSFGGQAEHQVGNRCPQRQKQEENKGRNQEVAHPCECKKQFKHFHLSSSPGEIRRFPTDSFSAA